MHYILEKFNLLQEHSGVKNELLLHNKFNWSKYRIFASAHSAYNYTMKHNIRMADNKIKIHRCRTDTALSVRKDFIERLKESGE